MAVSYDEADALADFATAAGITFPLLSDPDSAVIERFGILNTLIDPDDHPWYGIPFPGSYVVGVDGEVTAKFFESSFMMRPNADQLLRAALGQHIELAPLPQDPAEVVVDVSFDGDSFGAGIVRDLIVRFAVPEGQHLYGEPVPDAMVATSVDIEPEPGLVIQQAVLPPTVPHVLEGTGETLHVFEGEVVIRVPMTHLSRSLTRTDGEGTVQRVAGTVRWQACDDHVCHLPASHRFELHIPATRHSRPGRDNADEPNVAQHFARMTERRKGV